VLFAAIGCANCHVPALRTGPSGIAALDRVEFFPYSDFLVHDMGDLGDGIVQNGASGREMRTAPRWGARVRTSFLHDGRAETLEDAILAHDGQGRAARDRFAGLPDHEQSSTPQESKRIALGIGPISHEFTSALKGLGRAGRTPSGCKTLSFASLNPGLRRLRPGLFSTALSGPRTGGAT
jgi:hypothetical protein